MNLFFQPDATVIPCCQLRWWLFLLRRALYKSATQRMLNYSYIRQKSRTRMKISIRKKTELKKWYLWRHIRVLSGVRIDDMAIFHFIFKIIPLTKCFVLLMNFHCLSRTSLLRHPSVTPHAHNTKSQCFSSVPPQYPQWQTQAPWHTQGDVVLSPDRLVFAVIGQFLRNIMFYL